LRTRDPDTAADPRSGREPATRPDELGPMSGGCVYLSVAAGNGAIRGSGRPPISRCGDRQVRRRHELRARLQWAAAAVILGSGGRAGRGRGGPCCSDSPARRHHLRAAEGQHLAVVNADDPVRGLTIIVLAGMRRRPGAAAPAAIRRLNRPRDTARVTLGGQPRGGERKPCPTCPS